MKWTVNIHQVEALEQIPSSTKFMKDLVTKNRSMSHEPIYIVQYFSAIPYISGLRRRKTIRPFQFHELLGLSTLQKLCVNLGARINFITLDFYR